MDSTASPLTRLRTIMRLPVSVVVQRLLQRLTTPGCKQWLRGLAKVAIVALILIAALCAIEKGMGEWLWHAYQKEAAAKGVKLHYEEFDYPPIPDEENYAAAPIFQKAFASPEGAQAVAKMVELPEFPRPKSNGPDRKPLDLAIWQQRFLQAGWIDTPSGNDAQDVLTALVRLDAPLAEIRHASSRPRTQWPFDLAELRRANFRLSPIIQQINLAFCLRAKALLVLDRSDEALDELRYMARAVESLSAYPSTNAALVRGGMWNVALSVAEEGLQANRWNPSQLTELADLLMKGGCLSNWKRALSNDRCFLNYYIDRLATATPWTFPEEYRGYAGNKPVALMLALSPRGWVRKNQVELNQMIDAEVASINATREIIDPQFSRANSILENQSTLASLRLSRQVAEQWFPSSVLGSYSVFHKHSRTQQLVIACALVRFRNSNGNLPESLNQLIPNFAAAIPHDIMDGKPMRYRRTEQGGCILWSIGKDRKDDNGTPGKKGESAWRHPDWVTEFPPPPKP